MQEAVAEALRADPDILTEESKSSKFRRIGENAEFCRNAAPARATRGSQSKAIVCEPPRASNRCIGMGTEEEHARFTLRTGDGTMLPCILFRRAAEYGMYLQPGAVIDVAGELGINEFRDTRSLQLVVRDIRRGDGA